MNVENFILFSVMAGCAIYAVANGTSGSKDKKETPKNEIKLIPSSSLTLDQWRKTPALVTWAMKMKDDPTFQIFLQVMATESPVNYSTPPGDATQKLLQLGRIEGYHLLLNNLEAATMPLVSAEELEATFEPVKEAQ